MVTYSMMLVLVFCLIFILLFQAQKSDNSEHFFDISNTQAMRGFWCIIIMLVHVPSMYTNPLQDMLGSFAYIGVTFFFMVSAYGLKHKLNNLQGFWSKRLPKLLMPCFVSNLVLMGMAVLRGENIEWQNLLYVNHWVLWLIVCYVMYWFAYKFIKNSFRDVLIILGIMLLSVIMYLTKPTMSIVTWPTEVLGFAWGILLANYRDKLIKVNRDNWLTTNVACVVIAGGLGLLYLKYKYVVLWGDYLLKIVLGIAILLTILIANMHITIGNKISNYLGTISYEVYLIHGGVYGLVSFCFPTMHSGVYIIVSIVVTVVLSTIVYYVCATNYELVGRIAVNSIHKGAK